MEGVSSHINRKNWIQNGQGNIKDHYKIGKEIGSGAFGVVHLVTCRQSGETRAAKF